MWYPSRKLAFFWCATKIFWITKKPLLIEIYKKRRIDLTFKEKLQELILRDELLMMIIQSVIQISFAVIIYKNYEYFPTNYFVWTYMRVNYGCITFGVFEIGFQFLDIVICFC